MSARRPGRPPGWPIALLACAVFAAGAWAAPDDQKTTLVMVQTSAGSLPESGTGEALPLWYAAVALAGRR